MPEYSFDPEEYSENEGSTFSVSATVNANPDVNGSNWEKDGVALQSSSNIEISSLGLMLAIQNLQVSDSGVYTIYGSNDVGNGNASFTLTVTGIIPSTTTTSPSSSSSGKNE